MSDIHLNTPGGSSALIAPDCGFCCLSWVVDGVERLHLPEDSAAFRRDVKTGGIPLLYPYANRLRGDLSDHWSGASLVKRDENGLPIHGFLLRFSDWTDVAVEGATARATLEWADHDDLMSLFPHPHRLEISYELFETSLRVTTTVVADGGAVVPISFGWHPYFALNGGLPSKVRLGTPSLEHVRLDARCLPVRADDGALVLDATKCLDGELVHREFDDLFIRPEVSPSKFTLGGSDDSLTLSFGTPWRCLQIYHPEGSDYIAIEPMTGPGAALSDGRDHPVLEAGDTFSAFFEMSVA